MTQSVAGAGGHQRRSTACRVRLDSRRTVCPAIGRLSERLRMIRADSDVYRDGPPSRPRDSLSGPFRRKGEHARCGPTRTDSIRRRRSPSRFVLLACTVASTADDLCVYETLGRAGAEARTFLAGILATATVAGQTRTYPPSLAPGASLRRPLGAREQRSRSNPASQIGVSQWASRGGGHQ